MSLFGASMIEAVAQRESTPKERRLAFTVWSIAVLLCLAIGPFRAIEPGAVPAFLPGLYSASLVTLLATAAILRFRYRASGDLTLAYLSIAYAYAACASIPYVLCFPGVFAASGLFDAGSQLSQYDWLAWHAGFVLLLGSYEYVERTRRRSTATTRGSRDVVRRYVGAVVLSSIVVFVTLYLARDVLPLLVGPHGFTPLYTVLVRCLVLAPCAALLAELALRTRLQRSPDLWLGLVITLAFAEAYVGGELAPQPYSLAWYAGGIAALGSGSIFLAVQMRLVFELLRAFAAHNRTLAEIAQHDSLTGLLNRAAFEARFEALWNQCRRVREPISLLVLDLDYFKRYNDHFGHIAGDEALRRIGRELAGTTKRPTDLTCRIGGEEFAIILPFTDERGAAIVAERVVLRVRDIGIVHAPDLPLSTLTISVGAATSHGGAIPHTLLFEHADAALYHAKRSGRDRVGSVRPAVSPTVRAV